MSIINLSNFFWVFFGGVNILGNFWLRRARVPGRRGPITQLGSHFPASGGRRGDPPIMPFDPDKSFVVCEKSVCNLLISVNTFLSRTCQFAIREFERGQSRVKYYIVNLMSIRYNNTWQTKRQEQTALSRGECDYQRLLIYQFVPTFSFVKHYFVKIM